MMRCFLIMPFGNSHIDVEAAQRLDHVYNEWVKPTVESVLIPGTSERLECLRADKDHRSGEIITHIIENLVTADIVIADLSGRNANVFYELGVRHTIGKKTILTTDNIEDVPFDLRHLRMIPYEFDPRKLVLFRNTLKETLDRIISEQDEIANPVTSFLLKKEMRRINSTETRPDMMSHGI